MSAQQDHFGYKKVDTNERQSLVNEVFSSVASKYDIMNDAMSLGVHHIWKKLLISMMPNPHASLLDVAGGTGDIAFKYFEKTRQKGANPHISICDINVNMLKQAQSKAIDRNILQGIDYTCGNAEHLPFADNSFDYYTIAFGIRNVTDLSKALNEARRVLKPCGKFLCLEFSHIDNEHISKIYDYYSMNIIPQIGKLIAGNKEAYQYLVESIRKFPNKDDFAELIKEAGFSKVKYHSLNFGIATIHTAYKI